jgi:hypothetical protein
VDAPRIQHDDNVRTRGEQAEGRETIQATDTHRGTTIPTTTEEDDAYHREAADEKKAPHATQRTSWRRRREVR